MGRVVVVGGVNADLVVTLERRPDGGETVVGSGPVTSSGGKGANQAVAAVRAGAAVDLVAVVGADPWGAEQVRELKRAGVRTDHVRRSATAATGVALITVTPDGENAIAVGAGANRELCADDVLEITGSVDVVVAQSEPGPATIDAAARRSAELGARLVVNAAPVLRQDPAAWTSCDPLVVNQHEAADLLTLLGAPPATGGDGSELARPLRAATGARSVVITLGARGAVVESVDGSTTVDARHVEAVDTTGAGDVLVGSLAARLAAGDSLVDAVRIACSTASLSTTWRGAREPGATDGLGWASPYRGL